MIGTLPAVNAGADRRDLGAAMRRGFVGRCPKCGEGQLFRAYLKVADACDHCGEDFTPQRADDAPPYFTMLIVGHFIVAGILAVDSVWPNAPMLLSGIVWAALTVASSLALLPRIKGTLIGLQWAMRMHGFGAPEKDLV